jgi:glycosyltransferase involved in cell wall biosynthesis
MNARLISFHHRLLKMNGHRYPEALGLASAVPVRGMEFSLLMSQHADAAVREAFPQGAAVLHCPVFRMDWSFDERTADFVAMLHCHVDPLVRSGDWLFVTTGTQCEVRALARWMAETPRSKRPWAFTMFHSDRWNRYGAEERNRQVDEFRVAASELAQLEPDAARRIIIGSAPEELCAEVSELLGLTVPLVPQVLPGTGYVEPPQRSAQALPVVGILGGVRPEKGAHLIGPIIAESTRLGRINFAVQLFNEQLSEQEFDDLCGIAQLPNVRGVHGALDQASYRSLLASCDIVLFPHLRLPYRQRRSGIFVEAAFTGRPVVVPSGTWMARQVESRAVAGTIYHGDDPATIAGALMRAVDALPALATLARQRAPEWQRTSTLDALLDWVAAEIARRELAAAVDLDRSSHFSLMRRGVHWLTTFMRERRGSSPLIRG